jgi:hypothetical protein
VTIPPPEEPPAGSGKTRAVEFSQHEVEQLGEGFGGVVGEAESDSLLLPQVDGDDFFATDEFFNPGGERRPESEPASAGEDLPPSQEVVPEIAIGIPRAVPTETQKLLDEHSPRRVGVAESLRRRAACGATPVVTQTQAPRRLTQYGDGTTQQIGNSPDWFKS